MRGGRREGRDEGEAETATSGHNSARCAPADSAHRAPSLAAGQELQGRDLNSRNCRGPSTSSAQPVQASVPPTTTQPAASPHESRAMAGTCCGRLQRPGSPRRVGARAHEVDERVFDGDLQRHHGAVLRVGTCQRVWLRLSTVGWAIAAAEPRRHHRRHHRRRIGCQHVGHVGIAKCPRSAELGVPLPLRRGGRTPNPRALRGPLQGPELHL
mmetsp:Transcript_80402/g.232217  ORF Transcript_80402/g.232217 Transcript_80402/m.232217 type:complete len:212 (+) Transcript_80402:279-914(+)